MWNDIQSIFLILCTIICRKILLFGVRRNSVAFVEIKVMDQFSWTMSKLQPGSKVLEFTIIYTHSKSLEPYSNARVN